ncbi:DUF3802 domain-containing protein [Psychromonas sp. B3M02]|uniref:DUF3802 family protein n=1 Tax=unclassified Psychromonas TaxID=2614957 RepID=UPI000DEA32BE|nr:DUF3802 family protein [Psychromonas sp. B3M02]RBW43156.1 DUF3802 domain-containing protein [Psychromonas sp. B3M02]
MLLKSDAYDACIGYFADNLSIFEDSAKPASGEVIADIVLDQASQLLMTFCQQQSQLSNETRLMVVAEGDKLVEDIEQILGKCWEHRATQEQIEFIKEYFLLVKNSLDSQVPYL